MNDEERLNDVVSLLPHLCEDYGEDVIRLAVREWLVNNDDGSEPHVLADQFDFQYDPD